MTLGRCVVLFDRFDQHRQPKLTTHLFLSRFFLLQHLIPTTPLLHPIRLSTFLRLLDIVSLFFESSIEEIKKIFLKGQCLTFKQDQLPRVAGYPLVVDVAATALEGVEVAADLQRLMVPTMLQHSKTKEELGK